MRSTGIPFCYVIGLEKLLFCPLRENENLLFKNLHFEKRFQKYTFSVNMIIFFWKEGQKVNIKYIRFRIR